jgi:hypothetical protein
VPIVPLLLLPAARGFSRRLLIATVILGASLNLIASSVSYLEDQAMSEGMKREVYYERDPSPEPGLPWNVYRPSYTPEVSLPKTLLASKGEPGTGLDLFCRHMRQSNAWLIGFVPLALGAICVALGVMGLRKTFRSSESAAILPTRIS